MTGREVGSRFGLNAGQTEVPGAADAFARDTFLPFAPRMDAEDWCPDTVMPDLARMGFLGVTVQLGDAGSDLFTSGLVMQAPVRWNHAVAPSYAAQENLCDGSRIGALELTEPGAGSDALGSMATTARCDGDDDVLDGRRTYITNGPDADVVPVYAETDRTAGHRGISAFLVGGENRGAGIVMSGLDLESATIAMVDVGMAERALDLARTGQQFSRPIAAFQLVQGKLAEMYVAVETAKTFACRALAAGNDADEAAAGRGELHRLTAASILYAAEACSRVVADAVQIHAGGDYRREAEINRPYRATKLREIGAGTTGIRKVIIAGELLH